MPTSARSQANLASIPGSARANQNDPEELLEVFDARGNPTGRAKSRAAVHVSGDWHQTFHCWIVRRGPRGPEVVLQRRAAHKDTFPNRWDAAAAGHWRFGESPEEAAREIVEELGLSVDFARLRWRGREPIVRRHPNGLIDREHHQVYVLPWDAPLATYRPDPREVAGLAAVAAPDLLALAAGRRERAEPTEAVAVGRDGSVAAARMALRKDDLVPYSAARLRRLFTS